MLQRAETPSVLRGVDASREFFAPCFAGSDPSGVDRLWVAHVDGQARCIHLADYDRADGALPVGAIIGDALRFDSAGVVLAHRAADGATRPRHGDRTATRDLAEAAEAIDLALVDHLVFAGTDCASYRRMGLL